MAFTSDNGYFLGEHRIRQGKILPYEPALAVPLLVARSGIPAGEVRTDPFTSIDFAPTILEAAGTAVDWPLNGRSMLEVARTGDRGWDRGGAHRDRAPQRRSADLDESGPELKAKDPGPTAQRFSQGVRTRNFLYVEHASGEVELYDMRTDPASSTNLAGQASTPPTRRHWRGRWTSCATAGAARARRRSRRSCGPRCDAQARWSRSCDDTI